MRILLISDIHANPWALHAVEAAAGPVDRIFCAGDVVNYGPDPSAAGDRGRAGQGGRLHQSLSHGRPRRFHFGGGGGSGWLTRIIHQYSQVAIGEELREAFGIEGAMRAHRPLTPTRTIGLS